MDKKAFHYRLSQADINACLKDVEKAPDNPFLRQKLARLLSTMGRYEEAAVELEHALAIYLESSLCIGWLEVEIREELGLAKYGWGITTDNRKLAVEGRKELEKARRRASELGLVARLPSELRVHEGALVEVKREPIQVAQAIEWHLMGIDSCGSDWAWRRFDLDETLAQEVRRVQQLCKNGQGAKAEQAIGSLYEARFQNGTRKFSLVLCNKSELWAGLDRRGRKRDDTSRIRGDQYEGEGYLCFRKWLVKANPLIHKEQLSSLLQDRIEKAIKRACEEEGFSISVERVKDEELWGRSEEKQAQYAVSDIDRERERKKWARERALAELARSKGLPSSPEDGCESLRDTLQELTQNARLTPSQRRFLERYIQCLEANPGARSKEIALALGLSPPDLSQRLRRIREKMRRTGDS